jgi:hypothetical protein
MASWNRMRAKLRRDGCVECALEQRPALAGNPSPTGDELLLKRPVRCHANARPFFLALGDADEQQHSGPE